MWQSVKTRFYFGVILILVLAIVILTALGLQAKPSRSIPEEPPALPTVEPIVETVIREVEVEKLVEVERVFTGAIIQEGLNDMGTLVTQEYYFTEVMSYSSVKSLWNLELPYTESGYVAGYDGVVTAGVDFSEIRVDKDDTSLAVTIHVPCSRILNVDIDPSSLKIYSEKQGMWNPISIADYNNSLVQLESTARDRALQKDILKRGDENAQKVISHFIASLIDTSAYTVRFVSG